MNSKLTASNLVKAIKSLPKGVRFDYISGSKTQIELESVVSPEGPIRIRRYTVSRAGTVTQKTETISSVMLWRIANAFTTGVPINFDRVLGASYNTRSALEVLLAHTPEFYVCYPGRNESQGGTPNIKPGHKHLLWNPTSRHANGKFIIQSTDLVVSEIPSVSAIYDSLVLPDKFDEIDGIELKRRHSQIQVALLQIGQQLGFRTHIARNDHSIIYNNQRLGEMDGVVGDLRDEKVISSHSEGVEAAKLIDCVWFRNSRFMPAVIEIEQSTGVLSGLDRMKRFQDLIPPFETRWVIAAPDEDRSKVMKLASREQYKSLKTQFSLIHQSKSCIHYVSVAN
jgi:type II restriction enzyme